MLHNVQQMKALSFTSKSLPNFLRALSSVVDDFVPLTLPLAADLAVSYSQDLCKKARVSFGLIVGVAILRNWL
jgi:hypothetical protein